MREFSTAAWDHVFFRALGRGPQPQHPLRNINNTTENVPNHSIKKYWDDIIHENAIVRDLLMFSFHERKDLMFKHTEDETETEIVEVTLPKLPRGYRYTGEHRRLERNELWLNSHGDVCKTGAILSEKHHVVEKIKWEPAIGDTVFYLSTKTIDSFGYRMEVVSVVASGCDYLQMQDLYKHGQLFRTRKIAEEALETVRNCLSDHAEDNDE